MWVPACSACSARWRYGSSPVPAGTPTARDARQDDQLGSGPARRDRGKHRLTASAAPGAGSRLHGGGERPFISALSDCPAGTAPTSTSHAAIRLGQPCSLWVSLAAGRPGGAGG